MEPLRDIDCMRMGGGSRPIASISRLTCPLGYVSEGDGRQERAWKKTK
jgi:hypothetical protein